MLNRGFTGVGLGLRGPHIQEVLDGPEHSVPFWEIAPENVLGDGGAGHRRTMAILARDPVLTHGLTLSVGGHDPFDPQYLRALGELITFTGAPWHSEHLCFTTVGGANSHELLPIPFTRAAARNTIQRVRQLQDSLPVPLALENITYYAELGAAEMEEADFLADVLEGADCGWLLDVNNVYVNSLNWGFDPVRWLERTPLHRVVQMHVAGHARTGAVVLDTHASTVAAPVVELMQWVLRRIQRPVPVLLERDHLIPEFNALLLEREKLQEAYGCALAPVEVAHA
ncbi:DUF692 domain-containing protein [Geothrix sp. 21YS21S-2]|uniref:DUF692 domain-containing protein n=1 Tax=Geothrix sp. 21YS21S-2 TaxID=3068893 RepID=UPI0027BB1685|nr:DUF692 domain-containing protein [Geothrix sp. 21YS21S-2]